MWMWEVVTATCICSFSGCLLCFYLGTNVILASIVEDITNDLSQLNDYCPSNGERSQSHQILIEKLRNIVETYSKAKLLSISDSFILRLANSRILLIVEILIFNWTHSLTQDCYRIQWYFSINNNWIFLVECGNNILFTYGASFGTSWVDAQ